MAEVEVEDPLVVVVVGRGLLGGLVSVELKVVWEVSSWAVDFLSTVGANLAMTAG